VVCAIFCLNASRASADVSGYSDVWCAESSAPCLAVGSSDASGSEQAQSKRWNEGAWTSKAVPVPGGTVRSRLNGIACSSTSACVAVGSYDDGTARKTLAAIWNGTSWASSSTPNPSGATLSELKGVACTSSTACKAVGSYVNSAGERKSLVLEYNGTAWSTATTPQPFMAQRTELSAISCSSATVCRAVGSYLDLSSNRKGLAIGWEASSWKVETVPTPAGAAANRIADISCPVAGYCIAVGESADSSGAAKARWYSVTGKTWSAQASPAPEGSTASRLSGVGCDALGCQAVGTYEDANGRYPLAFDSNDNHQYASVQDPHWVRKPVADLGAASTDLVAVSCGTSCVAAGSARYGQNQAPRNLAMLRVSGEWTLSDGSGYVRDWRRKRIETWDSQLNGVACGPVAKANKIAIYCVPVGTYTDNSGAQTGKVYIGEKAPLPSGAKSSSLAAISCPNDPKKLAGEHAECIAVGSFRDSGDVVKPMALGRSSQTGSTATLHSVPLPSGSTWGRLTGVSCITPISCVAVGISGSGAAGHGFALAWDGSKWTLQTVNEPAGTAESTLEDVSCAAAGQCMAVGSIPIVSGGKFPLAYTLKTNSWEWVKPEFNLTGSNELRGVECLSTGCLAVGERIQAGVASPLAVTSGSGFTGPLKESKVPALASGWSGGLADLSCPVAGTCLTVGTISEAGKPLSKGLLLAWSGTEWTSAELSFTGWAKGGGVRLTDIGCATATSCAISGSVAAEVQPSHTEDFFTTATKGAGSSWSASPQGGPTTGVAYHVSCLKSATKADPCVAIGNRAEPGKASASTSWIRDTDGKWRVQPFAADPGQLSALDCSSFGFCMSVGASAATIKTGRWDGTAWTTGSLAAPSSTFELTGISCTSEANCLAAGFYYAESKLWPLMARYEGGSTWSFDKSVPAEISGNRIRLQDVDCLSAQNCVAVGYTDNYTGSGPYLPVVVRWNEATSSWKAESLPLSAGATIGRLLGVSCTSATACTAVGHFETSAGSSSRKGLIERWNGTGWSVQSNPVPGSEQRSELTDVSCYNATACVALGRYGTQTPETLRPTWVVGWNGTAWSTEDPHVFGAGVTDQGAVMHDVACTGAADCEIVGHVLGGGESLSPTLIEPVGNLAAATPPSAVTAAAASVTNASAELKGTVNPQGSLTSYQFEYGKTTSYGSKAPASPKELWAGTAGIAVAEVVTELEPLTTYHYRVKATSDGGTVYGEDKAFTTGGKAPLTTAASATGVSSSGATVNAKVNPNGYATSYQFEYGQTKSYGFKLPIPAQGIGSGTSDVSVSRALTELEPGTTYHYRVVASSPGGSATGEDRAFTTEGEVNTKITSPQPSYTSGAVFPVEFFSTKDNSTFKCSLSNPGGGKNFSNVPCTSPFKFLEEASPGWQTFTVAATDEKGKTDSTPASWSFNPTIYPDAPATSKMISPEEGAKSSSHFTLRAEWGAAPPSGGGITGVTFQYKLNSMDAFKAIPPEYVRNPMGDQVSWPLAVSQSPGKNDPVYFDARSFFAQTDKARIKFRAVLDGGSQVAGATTPVSTEYSESDGAPGDATMMIGPLKTDLVSGGYTLSRTDASFAVPGSAAKLEFSRVFEYPEGPNGSSVLGGGWRPSAPVEKGGKGAWSHIEILHEDAVPPVEEEGELIEDGIPAADWAELYDNEGSGAPFKIVGNSFETPSYASGWNLRWGVDSNELVLTDAEGTETTFKRNEVGNSQTFQPQTVSAKAANGASRYVYEKLTTGYRLKSVVAPGPTGVTCENSTARTTPGCRVLELTYAPLSKWTENPKDTGQRLDSIVYYNGRAEGGQAVSRYAYDPNGFLTEQWDPRISPNLVEKYSYTDTYGRRLRTVTPPGEQPWEFTYYNESSSSTQPLKAAKRPTLTTPSTAQLTLVYGVPISGEEAPFQMGRDTINKWGQTDYPVDATAIFPPSNVPDIPSSAWGSYKSDGKYHPWTYEGSYDAATVYYMDPEGQVVNTAAEPLPGADGPSITTSETDIKGNIIRSLSAENRLRALAAGVDSAAVAAELDNQFVFSEDGSKLLQSWGPMHKVRLKSGTSVRARAHTTVEYDAGYQEWMAPAGTPWPRLPTKETTAVSIPGQEDVEASVIETRYDWILKKPIEVIADPGGVNLRSRVTYNSVGQPVTESSAGEPEGKDAHTTVYAYYTAGSNPVDARCANKPSLAGLLCMRFPAVQPEGSSPKLLVTRYAAYDGLDQPTVIIESPGGTETTGEWRRTATSYDEAGRKIKWKQTGGGSNTIPTTEITYNSTTGAPETQKFVCEAPESCGGYDDQAVTVVRDSLGREIEYIDADGNKSTTSYDALSRPVSMNDGKGTRTVSYDELTGAPVQVSDSAAGVFTASYDADGHMVERGLPNGLVAYNTFDEAGAATSLRYEKTNYCSSSCTWLAFDVERAMNGKIAKQGSSLSNQEFDYDNAGRLVQVKDTTAGNCTTRSYTYDAASNRTKLVTRGPGKEGACDTTSTGVVKSYSYDSGDRLIGQGIAYDQYGRMYAVPAAYAGGSGALTTGYYSNDLVHHATQDGLTNTYELDAALRQRKVVKTGTQFTNEVFHYAAGGDSVSWVSSGSSWSRNIPGIGGELAAVQSSSAGTTLQLANLHGDIVATASLDPEATKPLSTSEADEFGNPKGESTPRYGWLGGSGRRTEMPSGGVQMGVRLYLPAMGRFTAPDPVPGGSANAYDYANADPVNGSDISGEKPDEAEDGAGCSAKLHVWSYKRKGKSKYYRFHSRLTVKCPKNVTINYHVDKFRILFERNRGLGDCLGKQFCKGDYCKLEVDCMDVEPNTKGLDIHSFVLDESHVCIPGQEYQVRVMLDVTAVTPLVIGSGGKGNGEPGGTENKATKSFELTAQQVCGHGPYD
jgi:RHS repeat-associated protein